MKGSSDLRKNLALFFVTSLVCLLLAEVVLRFVSPPPGVFNVGTVETPKAEYYGWAPLPGETTAFVHPDTGEVRYVQHNSQGWKDVEHDLEKPPGVLRVLFLGDSVTWGLVSLEDLYTRFFEQELRERGFPRVEVISMGVGGWGTDQELEALVREGLDYEPDIVVYQFCGNDLANNLSPRKGVDPGDIAWRKPFKYELTDGALKKLRLEPPPEAPLSAIKRKIMGLSARSALLYNLVRAYIGYKYHGPEKPGEEGSAAPVLPQDLMLQPGDRIKDTDRDEAWELMEALLLEMKRVSEGVGAAFVLFSFRGNENLEVISEGNAIPIVMQKRVYHAYENDPHPKPEGNKNMALDLTDFFVGWDAFTGRYKAL